MRTVIGPEQRLLQVFNKQYADSQEACVDVWTSLSALEKFWPFRLFGGMKRHLHTLRDAILFIRDDLTQMRVQVVQWDQAQRDILSSMDKVRDRNRRLERNMVALGASNAQINGDEALSDAEWQKAIYLYGRNLQRNSWNYHVDINGQADDVQVFEPRSVPLGDERVQRVAKIVNAAIDMERSGHYPEATEG